MIQAKLVEPNLNTVKPTPVQLPAKPNRDDIIYHDGRTWKVLGSVMYANVTEMLVTVEAI